MTPFQALSLGALQGVSELFPVSSLGQTILIPALIGWKFDRSDTNTDFLAFVVALHAATALALLIYFWKDWRGVFKAYLGSIKHKKFVYDRESKFAWMLVAGTVITAAVGAAIEKHIRRLFEDPRTFYIVALVLIINGFIMILADWIKVKMSEQEPGGNVAKGEAISEAADPAADAPAQRRNADDLTFVEATAVGATQILALIPGISRSGVSIVAGLLAGLSYEEAGRFSFMLGTPIIGAAAVYELPKLLAKSVRGDLPMNLAAAVLAGITAYLSVAFLMRFFRHHRLGWFGGYCIVFGAYAFWVLK